MVKVARADLRQGQRLALSSAREYMEAALASLDVGLLRPAGTAFALGAQEAGKAHLLGSAYEAGDATPDVLIYSHEAKVEAARTVLGSSALWLRDGGFQSNAFQAGAFDTGTPADEPTRLEVTYLNYGSTGWRVPPLVDASDLRGHIVDALKVVSTLETSITRSA